MNSAKRTMKMTAVAGFLSRPCGRLLKAVPQGQDAFISLDRTWLSSRAVPRCGEVRCICRSCPCGKRARFDLPAPGRDGDMGDRRVFRFAGAVRYHGRVIVFMRKIRSLRAFP